MNAAVTTSPLPGSEASRTPAAGPDDSGAGAPSPDLRLASASLQTQARELNSLSRATVDALAHPAGALSPSSPAFADIARRTVPRWHFAMLNDTARNTALTTALDRIVPRGATVLDIGTGTGLLAMSAVRAGAGHVYTCEENCLLAEIARQIIADQGMSDRVTVIGKRSTELDVGPGGDLPEPVDVLVSEIVDCGLIGEGLLPTVRHAREHLLRPGGVMMPVAARVRGQLIGSEAIAGLNRVSEAAGFDVSLMNVAATRGHFPVRLNTWPHQVLSEPLELASFELAADPLLPGGNRVSVRPTGSALAHGLAAWFEMDLGAGVTLSNSPGDASSHWMQALIAFDKPAAVTEGIPFDVEVRWSDFHLAAF